MPLAPKSVDCSLRVYWEDTDGGGIVYYANYLKFAERARTEWLRALGFEQSQMAKKDGIAIVVRRAEIEFLSPARLDDLLTVETHLHEVGKVRMTMQQVIRRGAAKLALLTVELACVNAQGKPARWPSTLMQTLTNLQA